MASGLSEIVAVVLIRNPLGRGLSCGRRRFEYVSTTWLSRPIGSLMRARGWAGVHCHAAHGLTPVWKISNRFRRLQKSRELGMYRQNYCGCRYSAAEAQIERHEARDAKASTSCD